MTITKKIVILSALSLLATPAFAQSANTGAEVNLQSKQETGVKGAVAQEANVAPKTEAAKPKTDAHKSSAKHTHQKHDTKKTDTKKTDTTKQ